MFRQYFIPYLIMNNIIVANRKEHKYMHRNYDDEFYLRAHDEEEQLIASNKKMRKKHKASEKIRCEIEHAPTFVQEQEL